MLYNAIAYYIDSVWEPPIIPYSLEAVGAHPLPLLFGGM